MISDRKIANAMSGKTARACDCCIKKRARWYCPADDAFLCQTCDVTVHSANPLARRHDRVRLKTASLKESDLPVNLPTWHRGTTPKTRTPRKKTGPNNPNPVHMVPQLGVEETTSSQEEEGDDQDQLLYRVPMFDPFVVDLSSSTTTTTTSSGVGHTQDGYLPSDLDLEEFAADVETLLGKGFDDHEESYGIEQLGLLNNNDNNGKENYTPNLMDFLKPVKEEDDVVIREPFEFSFDYDEYDIPTTCEVQEDRKVGVLQVPVGRRVGDQEGDERENKDMVVMKRRKISLRLDYEAISEAWASHASPWMNGHRPQINPDDCWPHCLGTCGAMHHQFYVDNQTGSGQGVMRSDGGREARVSRYREKRRTRLFSKKIRYEVRKLNAEKRPRMKGRFVKRSSFSPAATVFPLHSK